MKDSFKNTFSILNNHCQQGQVLPYFLVCMLTLLISWAMILNMGKLLTDRMIMQNAADNAAISVAVHKARVMNTLGLLNYAIASSLYGPELNNSSGFLSYYKFCVKGSINGFKFPFPIPVFPMGGFPSSCYPPGAFAQDSQKKVASYLDAVVPSGGSFNVRKVRTMVKGFIALQDSLMYQFDYVVPIQYLANEIGRRQGTNNSGSDIVIIQSGIKLGLQRNKNGIEYFRSEKLNSALLELAKCTIEAIILLIPKPLPIVIDINEIYEAKIFSREKDSWLYADKDSFAKNQKIVVSAIRRRNSPSNSGYPVFGSWIGITWPEFVTVAAAGLYNSNGPMFTLEAKGKPSDKISPVIRAYKSAKYHGWDAHLVPIGDDFQH